jgi:hypothetical protein
MKRSLILGALTLCAMLWSGSGTRAQAGSGGTVGFGLGLPTLLEVRLGYQAEDFGVRAYGGSLIVTALGVDGYARLQTDWGAWRVGGGLAYLSEGFSATQWLALRALLGAELRLSQSVALTLEWRPGYPLLLSSGPGGTASAEVVRGNLVQYLLLALNLGFEFRV